MKIIKYLIRLFRFGKNKNTTTEQTEIPKVKKINIDDYPIDPALLINFDYNLVPEPVIEGNVDGKKIILVDDVVQTNILYTIDIKKINQLYSVDFLKEFCLVKCFGQYAGFTAYKYAVLEKHQVDYGIFDLTLGHIINVDNNILEVDGIDICYAIKQVSPKMNFLLCTAHTLNKNSLTMKKFSKKCLNGLNVKLSSRYMNKNSDRYSRIGSMVYPQYNQNANI